MRLQSGQEKELQTRLKKMKNSNGEAVPKPEIIVPEPQLLSKGNPVDLDISIEDALKLSELTLKVGDELFQCVIDPPRVKEAILTSQPMAGFPIFCDATVVNCNNVQYSWYLGIVGDKNNEQFQERVNYGTLLYMVKTLIILQEKDKLDENDRALLLAGVERCCTKKNVPKPQTFKLIEHTNTPILPKVDETFEGQIIACLVRPLVDKGVSMALASTCRQPVLGGPGSCPYHRRHKELKPLEARQFRVTSYNILSDALAETEFSKDGLFPYCPEQFVAWGYREHLLMDEILGYESSIVCLQELDKKLHQGILFSVNLKSNQFQATLESGSLITATSLSFRINRRAPREWPFCGKKTISKR